MKPILFNTDMVRGLQNGTKTATRRVVKDILPSDKMLLFDDNRMGYGWKAVFERIGSPHLVVSAPYRPGDILYVRETWQEVYETEHDVDGSRRTVNIRDLILNFDDIPKVEAGISHDCATAMMEPRMKYYVFKASDIAYADPTNGLVWRPSIHMPREAARIFLRVADVRVEQLYAITGKQARAEGFLTRDAFIRAFLTMYPDCTVKSWVWAIEFERISKEEAMM